MEAALRYVRLGAVSSQEELSSVARRAEGARKLQMAELIVSLKECDSIGFAAERHRWHPVLGDEVDRGSGADSPGSGAIAGIYVYSGDDAGTASVWALIEVGADDGEITLVKIDDGFTGGRREEAGLLQDALDRLARGERI